MKRRFDLQNDNGQMAEMISESDGRLILTNMTGIDFVRNYQGSKIVEKGAIAISKIVRLVIKEVEPDINDRLG